MKKLRILIFPMIISLIFILSACNTRELNVYNNYEYFGTVLKAAMYTDSVKFQSWQDQADTILSNLSVTLDEKVDNSDIFRFNSALDGQLIEVNEDTYNLVVKAKDIYNITNGSYNPCVYYLVDLWGFSSRFSDNKELVQIYDRNWVETDSGYFLPLPDDKYIHFFTALSDFNKVSCITQEGKFYLLKENSRITLDGIDYYAKIDLGGLIKGYTIDKLNDMTGALNITKGYISYGTSSISLLKNKKDKEWDLSLTNPRFTENSEDESYLKMQVMDRCISSSGDYEKFYTIDGNRYSHIIDGKTGFPVNNGVCAVTVICDEACLSDMLSTAIMVMGRDEGIEFMESDYCKNNNIQVIMAYDTGTNIEVITSSNANEVTLSDNNFYLS